MNDNGIAFHEFHVEGQEKTLVTRKTPGHPYRNNELLSAKAFFSYSFIVNQVQTRYCEVCKLTISCSVSDVHLTVLLVIFGHDKHSTNFERLLLDTFDDNIHD